MPVKMSMKRPAAAVARAAAVKEAAVVVEPTPKRQKLTPVERMCSTVLKGLQSAEDLPAAVQELLGDMLESSLGVPKSERQKYQDGVVDMVASSLEGAEASLQKLVEEAEAKVADLGNLKQAVENKTQEAEASRAAKFEEMSSKKHILAEHAMAFKKAKEMVMQAEADMRTAERAVTRSARRKEELESLMRDVAKPLMEGSLQGESASAAVAKLVEILTKFDFGESLVVPLPTVLSKDPVSRGSFDTMVITNLHEEVSGRIQEFETVLKEGEPDKAKHQAAIDAAEQSFKEARERQHESANVFMAVQSEYELASLANDAALNDLNEFGPRANDFRKAVTAAKQTVTSFKQGPMKAFATLRELGEVTEAAADAAAEEAATDATAEAAEEAATDAPAEEDGAAAAEGAEDPEAVPEEAVEAGDEAVEAEEEAEEAGEGA